MEKLTLIDRLGIHQNHTVQLANELYKKICEAQLLDQIVELPGYDLSLALHPQLASQQEYVKDRGLDYSDLLGEVMTFKAIADQILREEVCYAPN